VLAGLDVDAQVRMVGYPGSSVLDFLRPRGSSQPAAASLPDVAAGLARGVAGSVIANSERNLSGATALWVGDWRF